MQMQKQEIWKVKGEGKPVKKILESFNGDLYFVTDEENGMSFGYARLYSFPRGAEWGSFSISHLKESYGKYKIWEVKKKNWSSINTYKEGLLQKIEK